MPQQQMKILHLSTSDLEAGAARSAYRLHQGLRSIDVTSQMLVRAKVSVDETVIAERSLLTKLGPVASGQPLRLHPQHDRSMFSLQWFPDALAPRVAQFNPDIVNLHWVGNGFLKIETLAKLNKPIVWTFHDMWAFTGGCHYSQGCDRYQQSCGACPHLKSDRERDLSRWVWERKAKAWKDLNLTIVTPSQWMGKCARSSSLFRECRVEVIPYGIDTQKYQPIDRQIARNLLNLPQDKQFVLFGSMSVGDPRKGIQLLQAALQHLLKSGWEDKIELLVFGEAQASSQTDLGYKTHYLGKLNDDISLALAYSAANVFAAPSLEDNLPNTVIEALACGIPCVAFKIGGMPDTIEHQQNGYLAQPYEVEDFASGIAWVLEDRQRHQILSHRARERVEQELNLQLQADRYLDLYRQILG
jgi:glycosyltransferase involved in cell wall biosynthesis